METTPVQQRHPHDPNKGLNVKAFLIAVIVAGVVVALGLLIVTRMRGPKDIPKAATTTPTSSLTPPRLSPATCVIATA